MHRTSLITRLAEHNAKTVRSKHTTKNPFTLTALTPFLVYLLGGRLNEIFVTSCVVVDLLELGHRLGKPIIHNDIRQRRNVMFFKANIREHNYLCLPALKNLLSKQTPRIQKQILNLWMYWADKLHYFHCAACILTILSQFFPTICNFFIAITVILAKLNLFPSNTLCYISLTPVFQVLPYYNMSTSFVCHLVPIFKKYVFHLFIFLLLHY